MSDGDVLFDLDGYKIWAHPESRIGKAAAQGRPYEHRLLYHTEAQPYGDGLIVDVGASVGNHTLFWAARCGWRVEAWEPSPARYNDLLRNIGVNGLRNVRHRFGGLSDRARLGVLTSEMVWRDDPVGPCSAFPFDDSDHGGPVSMVKIDVEGHEPQVLRGMLRTLEEDRPDLYVESHTDEARQEVGLVVDPLGYRLEGTIQMGSRMDWWQAQ